jgi:hypothetical protein
MVDGDNRPDPYYHSVATRLRTLAQQMTFDDARAELLDIADRFDRMALWVERRSHQSVGSRYEINASPSSD